MTRPGINDIITLLVGLPEPDNKENQIVYQQTLCIKGRHLFCEAFFSKKMGKHIDLTGKKFSRLYVTGNFVLTKQGRRKWECRCDCGKTTWVVASNLISGKTKSCGCLNEEVKSRTHTKHGMSNSRLYNIWSNMKSRCECKTNDAYGLYGARGIFVCEEWHDFEKFKNWANQNGYSDNLTIDRIDSNGNYCPENCRWATAKEQGNNTRSCRKITYNGKTKTMRGWEEEMGLSKGIIYWRLKHGWSEQKAIETKSHACKGGRP